MAAAGRRWRVLTWAEPASPSPTAQEAVLYLGIEVVEAFAETERVRHPPPNEGETVGRVAVDHVLV